MAFAAPETLSVKRKRDDTPVETLVLEQEAKRARSDFYSLNDEVCTSAAGTRDSAERTVVWRRVRPIAHKTASPSATLAPPSTPTRRFHVSRAAGNVVLLEDTPMPDAPSSGENHDAKPPEVQPAPLTQENPRKRPGASATIRPADPHIVRPIQGAAGTVPSDETVRELQKLSLAIAAEEGAMGHGGPKQFKPRAVAPVKDRIPEAYAMRMARDSANSMDIDGGDYVYDTYVREVVKAGAGGELPEQQGNIGVIVLTEEDLEWWFEEDDVDHEFDTDSEDENAEGYYTNDYPEEEIDMDDLLGNNPSNYYHEQDDSDSDEYVESGDEEYGFSDEEDDEDDEEDDKRDEEMKDAKGPASSEKTHTSIPAK